MIRVHWHYTALNIMKNMGTWADGLMEQNLTKFIFYSDFIRHTIQRLNFCWMPKTNNFLHWIVGQWSTRVCPILTSHCYCVKRPLLNIDIALLLCKTTFISISRVDLHFTKFKGILSTSCVIFSYPKLLSISVLTFIKWRLNTELLMNTLRNVVFYTEKADHRYRKLINYALTWARPTLFIYLFLCQ